MNGGTISGNGFTQPGEQGDVAIGVLNFDMSERDAQMIMNGGSISGNLGNGIWNYDSLILNSGLISQNTHGGISTYEGSVTEMNGGTISGNGYVLYSNGSVSQFCYGGGMNIGKDSTVTINGGTITGNTGDYAVRLGNGLLTMTGGCVKDNRAGGIGCYGGQFTIGGKITFGNNVCPDSIHSCDLYAKQLPIHIASDLDKEVSMIVRLDSYPTEGQAITITEGYLNAQGIPQANPMSFVCKSSTCTRTVQNGEIAFTTPFICSMDAADFILPEGIREIETDAFREIGAEVVYIPEIPDGETLTIRSGAFNDCGGLRQIRIPECVTIEEGAFDGCTNVVVFGAYGTAAESLAFTYADDGFRFAEE